MPYTVYQLTPLATGTLLDLNCLSFDLARFGQFARYPDLVTHTQVFRGALTPILPLDLGLLVVAGMEDDVVLGVDRELVRSFPCDFAFQYEIRFLRKKGRLAFYYGADHRLAEAHSEHKDDADSAKFKPVHKNPLSQKR